MLRFNAAMSTPVLATIMVTTAARYTMTASTTTTSAIPISIAASTSHATIPTQENDCEIITTNTQVSSTAN